MPLLESLGLCKDYGDGTVKVHALRGVDLRVEAGEFVAIMGPSGCGKSTLLHLLGAIDVPTSGQILLEGRDLGGLDDAARSLVRRRRIGFVFQKMNLLPTLSAVDNVALPLRIDGLHRAVAHQRAHAALDQVAMEQRATHYPYQLSGGEQQRVAIARALVIGPTVVLADEPTGALDSANGQRIIELLAQCSAGGQTVVMVTHDSNLAAQASRVVRMHDGRIIDHAAAPPAASAVKHAAQPG